MNKDLNDTNKISNEENAPLELPLELVINKDSRTKEISYNSVSTEHRFSSNLCHESVTFDDEEKTYKSTADDTISNNDSNKLYIPTIEPSDMVLNIQVHLNNKDDSANSLNQHVRKYRFIVKKKM